MLGLREYGHDLGGAWTLSAQLRTRQRQLIFSMGQTPGASWESEKRRQHMRRSRLLAMLAGVATLSLALAAVPMSTTGAATQKNRAATVKYGGVLPIAMPWGSILDNFNPLTPGGTGATAGGTGSLI